MILLVHGETRRQVVVVSSWKPLPSARTRVPMPTTADSRTNFMICMLLAGQLASPMNASLKNLISSPTTTIFNLVAQAHEPDRHHAQGRLLKHATAHAVEPARTIIFDMQAIMILTQPLHLHLLYPTSKSLITPVVPFLDLHLPRADTLTPATAVAAAPATRPVRALAGRNCPSCATSGSRSMQATTIRDIS